MAEPESEKYVQVGVKAGPVEGPFLGRIVLHCDLVVLLVERMMHLVHVGLLDDDGRSARACRRRLYGLLGLLVLLLLEDGRAARLAYLLHLVMSLVVAERTMVMVNAKRGWLNALLHFVGGLRVDYARESVDDGRELNG